MFNYVNTYLYLRSKGAVLFKPNLVAMVDALLRCGINVSNAPHNSYLEKVCYTYYARFGSLIFEDCHTDRESYADYIFIKHPWDMYLHLCSINKDILAGTNLNIDTLLAAERTIKNTNMLWTLTMAYIMLCIIVGFMLESWTVGIIMGIIGLIVRFAIFIIRRLSGSKTKTRLFEQFSNSVCSVYRQTFGYILGHFEEVVDDD